MPNLKLFKRGAKRNYVPYNENERTVTGFVAFLARETGLQLNALLASKYPAYRARPAVVALLSRCEAALRAYAPLFPAKFLADYFADPNAFEVPRPGPPLPALDDLAVQTALKSVEVGEREPCFYVFIACVNRS